MSHQIESQNVKRLIYPQKKRGVTSGVFGHRYIKQTGKTVILYIVGNILNDWFLIHAFFHDVSQIIFDSIFFEVIFATEVDFKNVFFVDMDVKREDSG